MAVQKRLIGPARRRVVMDMRLLLEEQPDPNTEATTLFGLEYQQEVFRWAARRVRQQFEEDAWRAFWLTGVDGGRGSRARCSNSNRG